MGYVQSKKLIAKIADIFKVDCQELIREALTDKLAYQILAEEADSRLLRVAEEKVKYIKTKRANKIS